MIEYWQENKGRFSPYFDGGTDDNGTKQAFQIEWISQMPHREQYDAPFARGG